jgi:hypothetical protein
MNEHRKSDKPILPEKSSNKVGTSAAEGAEGRGLAKGNLRQQNAFRTQRREDAHSALKRVREAARKNKETRFTLPAGERSAVRPSCPAPRSSGCGHLLLHAATAPVPSEVHACAAVVRF